MAEAIAALGVAASVIAVVQVTASVLRLGWSTVQTLKGTTQKALLGLLDELTLLHGVLLTLHSQASVPNSFDSAVAGLLKKPTGPLPACKLAITDAAELIGDLSERKPQTLLRKGTSFEKDLESSRHRIERLKTVLLLALHSDQLALSNAIEKLLKDEFQRIEKSEELARDRLEDICVHVEMLITDSKLKRAVDLDREAVKASRWLSDINHEFNHSNAQKLREEDTGLWFLNCYEFKAWADGPPNALWLHAIPGAGKTILFSSAVDYLVNEKWTQCIGLAYFYFDFRAEDRRKASGMLRSVIAQLSRKAATFPPEVIDLYDHYKGRRSQPTLEELLDILVIISARSFPKVHILIDAVDECNERDILLPILQKLIASGTVSLLLSSRRERDITETMTTVKAIDVSVQADQVASDVKVFLEKKMKEESYLKTLSQDLQGTILQTLLQGANGMFRWVKCQLDLIKSLKRPKSIRTAIKTLPGTLDETYERILCSVVGVDERQIVRLLLQFVIFSARPMTVRELAEAVVIDNDDIELDEEARFTYSSDVFSGCECLFVLTGNEVGMAHYSIQEYLTSERILHSEAGFFSIRQDQAMEEICLRCLTYIGYEDFSNGPSASQEAFESRLERYPFLDYACNNWLVHCAPQQIQDNCSARFDKIWISTQHPKYLSWAQVFSDKSITLRRDFKSYTLLTPSMLYYPALWGLTHLCERILQFDRRAIDQAGGYYGTALQAASVNCHREVIRLLIEYGADVNQQSGFFGNALQAAAVVGDCNIALLLLRNGALVHTQVGTYGTSLQGAARHGHLDIVQLLLSQGAEVNQQAGPYGTALQAASNNGHEHIVQCLLENGASVNHRSGAFGTALEAACAAAIDHTAVVRLLLQRRADPEISGGLYSLPLIAASLYGHSASVVVLLEYGARPDTCDGVYGYPLQAAAMNGHQDTVEVLLQHGASVNTRGGRYSSAIQAAARNGHIAIIRKLLDRGAEVDEAAGYYGSALQAACRNGYTEVARVLLDYGANPSSEGGSYGNPLQAAVSAGRTEVIKLLIGRGCRVDQVGGPHQTALSAAAAGGHLEIINLLAHAEASGGLGGEKRGIPLGLAVASD